MESEPNVFFVKQDCDIVTLADLEAAFPLQGRYHFRFKGRVDGRTGWVDVVDKHSRVSPFENGVIRLKVLRLSWEEAPPSPTATPGTQPTDILGLGKRKEFDLFA